MADKNKHKLSIKKKNDFESILSHYKLKLNDNTIAISLLLPDLYPSQLNYFIIKSINKFCNNYIGIDINIFNQANNIPFIVPSCPILSANDIRTYKDPIICTNISTCIDAIDSMASCILFYMFDIDLENIEENYKISNDPRVYIVLRNESVKNIVQEEFKCPIIKTIIPDFDIEKIIKIIREIKNEEK